MAKIKGSKLTTKLDFVRDQFGPGTVEAVLASMPPEDSAVLSDVSLLRWYPLETYERLVRAICEVAAGGDEAIYDRMGAHTADHQLRNVYASFARGALLQTLRNMAPMHAHMNDPGRMEVADVTPSGCTIEVREPKSSSPVACRISRAFYRRVAELSGATGVEVNETTCSAEGGDACRFRLSWAGGA